MKTHRTILLAIAATFFATAAFGLVCSTVTTHNKTPYWVWVTIQDLGKFRNLDWGWPPSARAIGAPATTRAGATTMSAPR